MMILHKILIKQQVEIIPLPPPPPSYHQSTSGGNETNDVTVAPENAIDMDDDLTQDPDKTTGKIIPLPPPRPPPPPPSYHQSTSGGNETNDVTVAPENAIDMDDDLTQDPDKTAGKIIPLPPPPPLAPPPLPPPIINLLQVVMRPMMSPWLLRML